MKKVYTQTKKVPACPRCEDIAAWKHDAKGRWWCKTCNKAFTPGITGANLNLARAHATTKKDQKQDPMRITRNNKLNDEETSEDALASVFDVNQIAIKAEEANDNNTARGLSLLSSPSLSLAPVNKIRRLTTRRTSSDRYKQIMEEELGDEFKFESLQEAGDGEDAMGGEEAKPVDTQVRVRSERPKKAPYACPHTDKPYYAKGKCRPCYWAEWRREGGKKGHAAKCAAEAQQISFDVTGTSPEAAKLSKRKKKTSAYDVLPSSQKKTVAIDDAQCVAFKLNKASDYQAIHDLLVELRSFYITGEILKGSHLLLVVKRLTQNPSSAVSELAKALFEEFAEILNEQRGSGENSPMATDTNDNDINNDSPLLDNQNKFLQQNIVQQTNYVTNANFSAFPANPLYQSAPAEFSINNPMFQASPQMFIQQPSFQLQNQPNPAFTHPTPPAQPTNTKSRRRQSTPNKAMPFSVTHPYNTPTDPLATMMMNNNNNLSFTPIQNAQMMSGISPSLLSTMQPNSTTPLSSSMGIPVALPGTMPMATSLPASTPSQMRLVQEITMMNSALAHITNMNYSMLNNLNTMRSQASMQQVSNFPTTNPNASNMGQMYVSNPNPYTLQPNYAFSAMPMANFVSYAPYDPNMQVPATSMSSDVTSSQSAPELDPAQMVESMLQQDDDVAEENNGNHTLECTDYNHSPTITNFTVAGEVDSMSTTDVINAEQTTTSTTTTTSTQPPSGETTFSRDSLSMEMTSDSSCTTNELELSDNYLTFLA